jgi:hypothetical protein
MLAYFNRLYYIEQIGQITFVAQRYTMKRHT